MTLEKDLTISFDLIISFCRIKASPPLEIDSDLIECCEKPEVLHPRKSADPLLPSLRGSAPRNQYGTFLKSPDLLLFYVFFQAPAKVLFP